MATLRKPQMNAGCGSGAMYCAWFRCAVASGLRDESRRYQVANNGDPTKPQMNARFGSGAIYCAWFRCAVASGLRDESRRYQVANNDDPAKTADECTLL